MAYQSFDTPFMNEGYMQDEIIRQEGVPTPKVDPKKKRKPYSKSGSPEILDRIGPLSLPRASSKEIDPNMSNRMGAPLNVIPDDGPVIYMVAPGTGYGPQGNRFGGSTAENKALNLAYQGQGSESAKQAIRNDPGTVDFYLDMAKEVQRKEVMKPMNQRNQPPQKQVSLGQLLGK